jgi:hypothetical protein
VDAASVVIVASGEGDEWAVAAFYSDGVTWRCSRSDREALPGQGRVE